jgi:hypothetical protein
MVLAFVPVVTETVFAACSQTLDTGTAKGIALYLTEGAFDLRDSGRVVFLLLLEREDVAVLDSGSLL